MYGNHTSLNAAGIPVHRAIESEKLEGERLLHIPYARQWEVQYQRNNR